MVVAAATVDDELVDGVRASDPATVVVVAAADAETSSPSIVDNPIDRAVPRPVDGAIIVGSLTLAFYRIPTGLKAWIEDVVVDDAARGRGVGAALNQAALDEARRRGAKDVSLTSRPSREAANRLVPAARLRRPRHEHVPLHVRLSRSVRARCQAPMHELRSRRARRSSAAWRTCQSRSVRARLDRGVDLGAVERCQRQHGAAAHGRLVATWRR